MLKRSEPLKHGVWGLEIRQALTPSLRFFWGPNRTLPPNGITIRKITGLASANLQEEDSGRVWDLPR